MVRDRDISNENDGYISEQPFNPSELQSELDRQKLRERLSDSGYLPTTQEIIDAFGGYRNSDERQDWHRALVSFCGSNPDERNFMYEVLNREFIQALQTYLRERITQIRRTGEQITILEVGAGNGRLTHFLQQGFTDVLEDEVEFIATDGGEWGIPPQFPVEAVPYEEAIERHKPTIVICSWMPYEEDWTPAMRHTTSVQEYLLIGEGGYSQAPTGTETTWGRREIDWDMTDEERETLDQEPYTPEYETDGFAMEQVPEITQTQICKNDTISVDGEINRNSNTYSFRRLRTI